jgi:hypothetical protein
MVITIRLSILLNKEKTSQNRCLAEYLDCDIYANTFDFDTHYLRRVVISKHDI